MTELAHAHPCSGFQFGPVFGRTRLGQWWYEFRDGDALCRAIYDRHYSRYRYADGRQPKLFVGPGEKCVMMTAAGDALWVWRKFHDASGQAGVNCSVFRNEGATLSSALILDAEAVAWRRWPGHRLYTYVNPRLIRSTNPGACYRAAGWRRCGVTKRRQLVILEKRPCTAISVPVNAARNLE